MVRPSGRFVVLALLAWLGATQVAAIHLIQNGLSPTAGAFGEADAVRSAEHYARFGFTADAGLPHVVYGSRFPDDGSVREATLYRGVYTHYPPLPNLLCGLFAAAFGVDRLWMWRFVPAGVTLAATWMFFVALRGPLGPLTAAAATVLASAVPMTLSHMHGLGFQGYAHALLLVELGLLTNMLFCRNVGPCGGVTLVALVAFVQGWLSFEYVFVVSGAAIPLAFVARQHGYDVPGRQVLPLLIAASAGFLAANALHFFQVAMFHGSVASALADFRSVAMVRMFGKGDLPYLNEVLLVGARYAKALWIGPNMAHFAGLLPAFTAGLLLLAGRRLSADGLGLAAAYGLAALWLVVMPEHAHVHQHFVPRIFFLAYYTAVLGCVLRARAWFEGPRDAALPG